MIDLTYIDFVKPIPEDMDIKSMTVEDFKAVHFRNADDDLSVVYSIVILPTDDMHDSGYHCMDFVAVNKDFKPICRLSGCSDVLHFDGIGGYGLNYEAALKTQSVRPKGWSIDCLPCGLLRVFSSHRLEVDDFAMSSYCIYSVDKEENE